MRIYFGLLLLLVASCTDLSYKTESAATPRPVSDTIVVANVPQILFTSPPFEFNYDVQKRRCRQFYAQYKKDNTLESQKKLINFLMDSLVACWYGTPWDYNGISQVPGQGQIACGYLVTTTLRDAGMKINRVKMAQCIDQNLLWDLCTAHQKFSDKSLDYFVKAIEKTGYGLYIVGLDNHTGYIYHDGKEVWFVHSGVYPPAVALKEKAINSRTLNNSRYRVFGRIVF